VPSLWRPAFLALTFLLGVLLLPVSRSDPLGSDRSPRRWMFWRRRFVAMALVVCTGWIVVDFVHGFVDAADRRDRHPVPTQPQFSPPVSLV
jgi:hypothetical protein